MKTLITVIFSVATIVVTHAPAMYPAFPAAAPCVWAAAKQKPPSLTLSLPLRLFDTPASNWSTTRLSFSVVTTHPA